MAMKVFMVVASLLVFVQLITASQKGKTGKGVREFIDVNGKSYFIDDFGYHRDESNAQCQSMNMSMVAFDDAQEWSDMEAWLFMNDMAWSWFWTAGLQDENSTIWYWESTTAEVSEFNWAPGQPSMNEDMVRSCINFNADQGGWDDDDCELYLMGTMCE